MENKTYNMPLTRKEVEQILNERANEVNKGWPWILFWIGVGILSLFFIAGMVYVGLANIENSDCISTVLYSHCGLGAIIVLVSVSIMDYKKVKQKEKLLDEFYGSLKNESTN